MSLGGIPKQFLRRFTEKKREESREAVVQQRIASLASLPKTRIAVAGAGQYAQRHLEVLAAMPNVEIVGVSNRGGSDISSYKAQYGVKETYGDYRKMLDSAQPDGVFVVVSHYQTVPVAQDCLERGLACFVEKPAGFVSSETAQLADAAAKNNCLNMVGVNRRYISVLNRALASVLQRGPLMGVQVEAPEAIRRIRATGGHNPTLYDQWLVGNSIHAIDLLRRLGGEVLDFDGRRDCRQEPNGDSFVALMRLSHGGIGVYTAHWLSIAGWTVTLYGDGVKAVISLDLKGELQFERGKRAPIAPDPIDQKFKPGLFAQNEAFIRALALGEPLAYPASDLADSTRTMQLIEAIATA